MPHTTEKEQTRLLAVDAVKTKLSNAIDDAESHVLATHGTLYPPAGTPLPDILTNPEHPLQLLHSHLSSGNASIHEARLAIMQHGGPEHKARLGEVWNSAHPSSPVRTSYAPSAEHVESLLAGPGEDAVVSAAKRSSGRRGASIAGGAVLASAGVAAGVAHLLSRRAVLAQEAAKAARLKSAIYATGAEHARLHSTAAIVGGAIGAPFLGYAMFHRRES